MLPPKTMLPRMLAFPVNCKFEPVMSPDTFNAPVISVFTLILKPFACEMDAVALPSEILFNSNPVIPLAGMS